MLVAHVERYLALRRALGFKLREVARHLRAFAAFATAKGDAHVRVATAMAWLAEAPSLYVRSKRYGHVVRLARFLHAEDPVHEIPPADISPFSYVRPLPYIYTPEEISRIVEAASRLRKLNARRGEVYATLFGLIASTGLRISEALGLILDDVLPDGVLRIRQTKFGKSRLVPLHPTAVEALGRYLEVRRRLPVADDHVFLSVHERQILVSTAEHAFHRILRRAGIAPDRPRRPRIHDLRHTFATRVLEKCPMRREAVARQFVALATYMGHANIENTYWYFEATPDLMAGIAAAAEALVAEEGT